MDMHEFISGDQVISCCLNSWKESSKLQSLTAGFLFFCQVNRYVYKRFPLVP